MTFSFTISRDVWKHDLFVITFDSKFTVASGVTCEQTNTATDTYNYYNTTSTVEADKHKLDCVQTTGGTWSTANTDPTRTGGQMVYVYGNAFDIDLSTIPGVQDLTIKINSITNPYAVFSGYTWKVHTQRF